MPPKCVVRLPEYSQLTHPRFLLSVQPGEGKHDAEVREPSLQTLETQWQT